MHSGTSVGIYWDFENIHAGVIDQKYGAGSFAADKQQSNPERRFKNERSVNIKAVLAYVATHGDIAIHRAYADWSWLWQYKDQLNEHAIDLIQLFPRGGSSKNSADIRIVLDVMEDISKFPNIGTVAIVSSDSDFLGLAQKVRQTGRSVIGIGTKASVAKNRYWPKACTEFKFYSNLIEMPELPVTENGLSEAEQIVEMKKIVHAAVETEMRSREQDWVVLAAVGNSIRRIDPTFDPRNYGCKTLKELLEAYPDVVKVGQGTNDTIVSVLR